MSVKSGRESLSVGGIRVVCGPGESEINVTAEDCSRCPAATQRPTICCRRFNVSMVRVDDRGWKNSIFLPDELLHHLGRSQENPFPFYLLSLRLGGSESLAGGKKKKTWEKDVEGVAWRCMGVDRKAIKPDRKLLIIIQSNGVSRKKCATGIICLKMRENAKSKQQIFVWEKGACVWVCV